MFIDYVPLMLINMAAGLAVLAVFYVAALGHPQRMGHYAPTFAIVGLGALVMGLRMVFTWPLGGVYNITNGDLSVLLGLAFLAAALTLARGWSLIPVGIYAFFAGAASIVVGVQVWRAGLTAKPWMSGWGYVLTGCAGLLTPLVVALPRVKALRGLAAGILIVAACLWAVTGYGGYFMHLEKASPFHAYRPAPLRAPPAAAATQPDRPADSRRVQM